MATEEPDKRSGCIDKNVETVRSTEQGQAMEDTMRTFIKMARDCSEDVYALQFFKIRLEQDEWRDDNEFKTSIGQLFTLKNRYRDILPYDKTRVTLSEAKDEVDGIISTEDELEPYINASFINGADCSTAYIAAQGPLSNTVNDFWKMIMQYNVDQVVMLCNLIEGGRPKCERYWPQKGDIFQIGGAKISLIEEQSFDSEYIVRCLKVETSDPISQQKSKFIRQYHYMAWPDHGCPESVDNLLNILDLMHMEAESEQSDARQQKLTLVHCSAGCGRTGTIIAIDIVLNLLKTKTLPSNFSVYDLVLNLRKQRSSMVQSRDQYQFLHHALYELFIRHIGDKYSAEMSTAVKNPLSDNPETVQEQVNGKTAKDNGNILFHSPKGLKKSCGNELAVCEQENSVYVVGTESFCNLQDEQTSQNEIPFDANGAIQSVDVAVECQNAGARKQTMTDKLTELLTNVDGSISNESVAPSFDLIDSLTVHDWPEVPNVKPDGPEDMPWPDVKT